MPREKRDFTRISGIRNPSLIVIATEGEKTEQQYFNGVKLKCKEYSSKIHVEILDPRPDGLSAPKYVLHQLNHYKKEYGMNSNDELCMVIDRDKQSWTEAEISSIAEECSNKKYLLALSNPCFEVWLLLHLKDIDSYPEEQKIQLFENKRSYLKTEIRNALGEFNPSNLDIDNFWHGIDNAIQRAEFLDTEPNDRWPNSLGTRVYLVMKKLMNSINQKA